MGSKQAHHSVMREATILFLFIVLISVHLKNIIVNIL